MNIRCLCLIQGSDVLFDSCNPLISSVALQPCLWMCASEHVTKMFGLSPKNNLTRSSVQSSIAGQEASFFPFALTSLEITRPIRLPFPDILPSKLRSDWFYFSHQKDIIFLVSPFKSTSPLRMCEFYLSFCFSYPESKSSLNPAIMEMAKQTKDKKESSTPEIANCFFLSSFFPFAYHCFFWHTCERSKM